MDLVLQQFILLNICAPAKNQDELSARYEVLYFVSGLRLNIKMASTLLPPSSTSTHQQIETACGISALINKVHVRCISMCWYSMLSYKRNRVYSMEIEGSCSWRISVENIRSRIGMASAFAIFATCNPYRIREWRRRVERERYGSTSLLPRSHGQEIFIHLSEFSRPPERRFPTY